jgi:hypothetical protein
MWQQLASGLAVLRNCVWVSKEALVTSEEGNVRELLRFRVSERRRSISSRPARDTEPTSFQQILHNSEPME